MTVLPPPDFWRRLTEATSSWPSLLQAKHTRPIPSSARTPQTDPSLHLPTPTNFTYFVNDLPVSPETAHALKLKIEATIEQQRKRILTQYTTLSNQPEMALDPEILSSVGKTYERSFAQLLLQLRQEVIESCQKRVPIPEAKKAPFNFEYTPLLEQYFEYNAYPSARDRDWLAKKTMMSQRQIEVWFQNHRRRARKDGVSFRKLSTDNLPHELDLELLEQRLSPLARPQQKQTIPPSSTLSRLTPPPESLATPPNLPTNSSRTLSILDTIPAPSAFAFPTPFQSSLPHQNNRFPCLKGDFTFPAPTWARKPATASPLKEMCSLKELTRAFGTLRIHGSLADGPTNRLLSCHSARILRPIAPHPALVRATVLPSSTSNTSSSRARRESRPSPKRRQRLRLPSYISESNTRTSHQTRTHRPILRSSSSSSLSSSSSYDELDTPRSSPSPIPVNLPSIHVANESPWTYVAFNDLSTRSSLISFTSTPFDVWATTPKSIRNFL